MDSDSGKTINKTINWKTLTNDQRNHLIAQEVLGLVPCKTGWIYLNAASSDMALFGKCEHQKIEIASEGHRRTTSNCYPADNPSPYSTFIGAAMSIVEFVRGSGFEVEILTRSTGDWTVYFSRYVDEIRERAFAGDVLLSEAICIAVLRVKGFDVLT